ncbi:MAG: tetratricopeptide repeat protein [Bryobacteraceae bacterium]
MGKIDKLRKSREASRQAAAPQEFVAGRTGRAWRRHRWLLAIWGLVFIAYSNSFQAGLVFDNAAVIGKDPRIREATPQNVESILTGRYWYGDNPSAATAGLYRPFTTFSYLLNYAVLGNGPRPSGYHGVNLALHEINVALVYALGVLIFAEIPPALALAAIWGLHPLLTESVTNIVGRADLLAACGVLAGLLCHARGASAKGWRRVAWLAGLAAAQAVGLFSKENAAVLPGILLLYDLTWSERATWRRRAPAYAAVALPMAAFFYLRSGLQTHMLIGLAENPLATAGFWTARFTAVKVIGKFLWLFLWPVHLSADYSYNAIPLFGWRASNWEDAKALVSLAVCLGAALFAVMLAVRRSRTGRPLLFFLVFFFAALLPTSNLIVLIGSIMAERFIYLPSVGLAGCVVAAVHALATRRPLKRPAVALVAWAALGLACLALAARTYARNFDWQDERTLWTSAVKVCPESAKAHNNLGIALSGIPGRLPEAIAEYRAALRIDPRRADVYFNLGNALSDMPGRLPEAIDEYHAALRIDPDYAKAHNNLGNALSGIPSRLPEAIAEYQAALRIDPHRADAHYNMGIALSGIPGRLPEAIAEYRAALRIDPHHADAHDALANTLAHLPGRLPEAIAEYQAVLRIQPDRAAVRYNLANALASLPDRLPEAIAQYQAALRIDPDSVEARVNLANALSQTPGRLLEAIDEYRAALRIQPDLAPVHYNLANALARLPDRLPEAIAEYEAALRIMPDPQLRRTVDRLRAGRR